MPRAAVSAVEDALPEHREQQHHAAGHRPHALDAEQRQRRRVLSEIGETITHAHSRALAGSVVTLLDVQATQRDGGGEK